jgi:hypothetical protein
MIRNTKTVDPRDKDSKPVLQLESAMGAAIECFAGAMAIEVPRSRFAPVKTSADLLALRSDAYEVRGDGQVRLVPARHGMPPVVSLSDEYRMADRLDALGVPGMSDCSSLTVHGPIRFEPGVILKGDVTFENSGSTAQPVKAGPYRDRKVFF